MTIIEDTTAVRGLGLDLQRPPEAHRFFTPDSCPTDQIVRAITEADTELWDEAERLVYDVYREVGFCGPSKRQWVEEFDEYRAGSTFHVTLDGGRVVGAIRTMVGPIDRLPMGKLAIHTVPRSMVVCEFGSFAVREEYRGLGITNALHRAAVHHTFHSEADAFAMAVESFFVDVYRDLYGLPMINIADPVQYMGSETVARLVFLDQMINTLMRDRPNVLKWAVEGLEPETWVPGTIDLTMPRDRQANPGS